MELKNTAVNKNTYTEHKDKAGRKLASPNSYANREVNQNKNFF